VTVTHPIQKLTLALDFIGIGESNNYLLDKVSTISNNRTIPVLSNFFDHPNFNELFYVFDILEINLGVIPYEKFEEIFIEKLKIALRLKFRDILENNASNDSSNYIVKDNSQNTYALIKIYLLTGRYPWWASNIKFNIIDIIEKYIAEQPALFKSLLFEIGTDETVRKRISYNFSENIIKKLIIILEPSQFEYIFTYYDNILDFHRENKIDNQPETTIQKAVWYNILSYILTNQSSVFAKKEFLKKNLLSLSAFYNVSYFKLIELLFVAANDIKYIYNSTIYNFKIDIQTLFLEEIKFNKSKVKDLQNATLKILERDNKIIATNREVGEEEESKVYLLVYYLQYGTMPFGYEFMSKAELKKAYENMFLNNKNLLKSILLNLIPSNLLGIRLFELLSNVSYNFTLNVITEKYLNFNINTVHKSFIQLMISQNRTVTSFTSEQWKENLLQHIFSKLKSISYKDIFEIYLNNYSLTQNISLSKSAEIYYKELIFQGNKKLSNLFLEHLNSFTFDFINDNNVVIRNKKGLIDVFIFFIDSGYLPWWSFGIIEKDLKTTISNHFYTNKSEFLVLFKYAGKNKLTRNRYINLLEDNILNDVFQDFVNISITNYIHSRLLAYVSASYIISLDNRKIYYTALWETLFQKNYEQFDEALFFMNLHVSYSNVLNISYDNFFESLLKYYKSNNIHDVTIEKHLNVLKIANDSIYINFDSEHFEFDLKLDSIQIAPIVHTIFYEGSDPSSIKLNTGNQFEKYLIFILDYLYKKDRIFLINLLNDFKKFNVEIKYFLTEWIFNNNESEFSIYIASLIFPLLNEDSSFLHQFSYSSKSVFSRNIDSYKNSDILIINRVLNIQVHNSISLIQQYEKVAQAYLKIGSFETELDNEENVLIYLFVSIYKKSQKTLLDIFNNPNNNYAIKLKILSFFENAKNIQERQIFYLLYRSFDLYNYKLTQNPRLELKDESTSVINAASYNDNSEVFKPLYDILNFDQRDSSYLKYLLQQLDLFLVTGSLPDTLTSNFKNKNYNYILRLLLIEIYKISPKNLLQTFQNHQYNFDNILILNNLFKYSTIDTDYSIKQLFIDYFTFYISQKINTANLDTENSIDIMNKNFLTSLYNSNNNDLMILLNSNVDHLKSLITTKSIIQLLNFNTSKSDTAIIHTVLNLMEDAFEKEKKREDFIEIQNQILMDYRYEFKRINDSFIFINTILENLFILSINKKVNYVQSIVVYFSSLNIYQPIPLVKLIDYVIHKGNNLVRNHSVDTSVNNELIKKDTTIISQTNLIKKEKDQLDKIEDQLLFTSQQTLENGIQNESIYCNNAGIILFHPFIPTYFSRLDLLNGDGEFKDENCRYRAIHLLQLLVTDNRYDEHELVLNKILCNLPISDPIQMEINFTENELLISKELTNVILQRWSKMANSTVGHFRAAFILRDGRLTLKENGWHLNVEKRGYDILLGSLPWAYGIIKFKWMSKFLNTEWV